MAVTDQELGTRVRAVLAADPAIADLDVEVEVRDGVVYLRGAVDGDEQAARAAEVTRSVPGTVEVRSYLTVLDPPPPGPDPEVIRVRRRPAAPEGPS